MHLSLVAATNNDNICKNPEVFPLTKAQATSLHKRKQFFLEEKRTRLLQFSIHICKFVCLHYITGVYMSMLVYVQYFFLVREKKNCTIFLPRSFKDQQVIVERRQHYVENGLARDFTVHTLD